MAKYSALERALHRLALGSTTVGEMQFDIECSLAKPVAEARGEHVFVTGLARAGTTILMRSIYGSGSFGTLTYRDMPFVMAPNLWKRLHGWSSRDITSDERAHGDGILVDADSPEALEEVFWRVFLGGLYLDEDTKGLSPHEVPADVAEKFRKYVQLILKKSHSSRYLSKNNNNILRISGLLETFPEAKILVPFRHPTTHAQSLLRQHNRFMTDQDNFTRSYMEWLAHHEFGPGHRPFAFDELPNNTATQTDLTYWLDLWASVYGYLFKTYHSTPRLRFVCYEEMCHSPAAWNAVSEWLALPTDQISHFTAKHATAPDAAPEPHMALYQDMVAVAALD